MLAAGFFGLGLVILAGVLLAAYWYDGTAEIDIDNRIAVKEYKRAQQRTKAARDHYLYRLTKEEEAWDRVAKSLETDREVLNDF